jgi:hypothetical protein
MSYSGYLIAFLLSYLKSMISYSKGGIKFLKHNIY